MLIPTVPIPLNPPSWVDPFGVSSEISRNNILFNYDGRGINNDAWWKELWRKAHFFATTGNTDLSEDENGTRSTCYESFLFANDAGVNPTLLLDSILKRNCTLYNGTFVRVPQFLQRDTEQMCDTETYQNLLVYDSSDITKIDKVPLTYLVNDGIFAFHEFNLQSFTLDYTFSVNE